ncbi:MAG: hypothetical protein RI886_902 [Pseudomonadota bacterium]
MKTSDIIEARKNPELNPKVSINQYIRRAYDAASQLPNTNLKNLFVSFVAVPKLGINPRSKFNTPLGIYAYPAGYVIIRADDDKEMRDSLPYAGNQPYAAVFSAGGNIIDIRRMSANDEELYYNKLREFAKRLPKINSDIYIPSGIAKDWLSILELCIKLAPDRAKFKNLPGGRLWYVTYRFSNYYGPQYGQNPIVTWNKLFRAIGIDGVVDEGAGIIHEAEPTQAVFFSLAPLRVLGIVDNKYSPETIKTKQQRGIDTQQTLASLKRDIAIALKNDNVEILKPYLMREKINPLGWDWQILFRYIPQKLRYKLYADPSQHYSKMFWGSGKNLDLNEFEYAMKKNLSMLLHSLTTTSENINFIRQNKDKVLDALQSATLTELKDLPTYFSDALLSKLPWDDPEYLKYLVMVDPSLPKYDNFKDLVKNSPNKKKIVAAIKSKQVK